MAGDPKKKGVPDCPVRLCRHDRNVYRLGAKHDCVIPEAKRRYVALVDLIRKTMLKLKEPLRKYQIAQVIHQIGQQKEPPAKWWDAINAQEFNTGRKNTREQINSFMRAMDQPVAEYLKWLDDKVAPDLMNEEWHTDLHQVWEDFYNITHEVVIAPLPAVKKWFDKTFWPALSGEGDSVWSLMFVVGGLKEISGVLGAIMLDVAPHFFLKAQQKVLPLLDRLFKGKYLLGKPIQYRWANFNVTWEDVLKNYKVQGSRLVPKQDADWCKVKACKVEIKAFSKGTNAFVALLGAAAVFVTFLDLFKGADNKDTAEKVKDWTNFGAGLLAATGAVLDYSASRAVWAGGVPIADITSSSLPRGAELRLKYAGILGRCGAGVGALVSAYDGYKLWQTGNKDAAILGAGTTFAGGILCLWGVPILGLIGGLLTVAGVILYAILKDPPLLAWAKTCPFGKAPGKKDSAEESLKKLHKCLDELEEARVNWLLEGATQLRINAKPDGGMPKTGSSPDAGVPAMSGSPDAMLKQARRLEYEAFLLSLRRKRT